MSVQIPEGTNQTKAELKASEHSTTYNTSISMNNKTQEQIKANSQLVFNTAKDRQKQNIENVQASCYFSHG